MDVSVTTQHCQELVTSSALIGAKFEKFETTVKVAQILQACRPVADAYDRARRNLADEFVKAGKDGEYEKTPDGALVFKEKGGRRKFDDAVQALLETKTTVNVPPLVLADLGATDATPLMLFPLVPFCQV